MLLSDGEIREALESGQLVIENFRDDCVEPASYDCRVGRVLLPNRGVVDPSKERVLLRTGQWAEIETLEAFRLPNDIAAFIGIRSSITRRGVDYFSGLQVDPGYYGKVFIAVFNPGADPFEIGPGEPFVTLQFVRLGRPAEKPYKGAFQGLMQFPEDDVVRMTKMETRTLADVITSVGILETSTQDLADSVKSLRVAQEQQTQELTKVGDTVDKIFWAIIIAIGLSFISLLVQKILS